MDKIIPRIVVSRKPSTKDWTLSTFFINGFKRGVGVEDEHRDIKVKGETRIPNGMYKLGFHNSPKFSKEYYRDNDGNIIRAKERNTEYKINHFHTPHEMIHVLDVPNFSYILWHWGNTDKDSFGCYIVGTYFHKFNNREGVALSRKKYEEIYPLLYKLVRDSIQEEKPIYILYENE